MIFAMVKVFPDPVTPSKTCSISLDFILAVISLIASGWSPAGLYSAETDKSCLLDIILTVYKNIA